MLRDIGGLFLIAIREIAGAAINSIRQTLSIHIQPALKAADFIGQHNNAGRRIDECHRSGHGVEEARQFRVPYLDPSIPLPSNGEVQVPDRPGIGFEPDPDVIERFRI